MKTDTINSIVGSVNNVIINSDFRFSEIQSMVNKVSAMKQGKLTIKVKSGTLTDTEVSELARLGGNYLNFDFSEL